MQHPPLDPASLRRTERYVDGFGRQFDLFWTATLPPVLTNITGTRMITVVRGNMHMPQPVTFDIQAATLEEAFDKFDEAFELEFTRLQAEGRKAELAAGANLLTP